MALPQSRGNMPSIQQRVLQTVPTCEESQTRNANVSSGQSLSGYSSLSIHSCLPAISEPGNCNASGSRYLHGAAAQEMLWRHFFLDPTQWWDDSKDEYSSKESNEVLWMNKVQEPPCVESLLATRDAQLRIARAPASASCPPGMALDDKVTNTCSKQCEQGQLEDAVDALDGLVRNVYPVSASFFCFLLKRCVKQRNLVLGRRIHAFAVTCGYLSNTFLANHILRMYAAHGSLQEAKQVFAEVPVPDIFLWVSIISANAEHGEPSEAIKLYRQMLRSGVKPDSYVFVAVLKACAACADLECGKQVHADLLESEVPVNIVLSNCLINMYAKCGSLEEAQRVFDHLPTRNVVTWNTVINCYTKYGHSHEALALYARMQQEGMILANNVTFSCLLKACTCVGAVQQGRQLHSEIVGRGLQTDMLICNSLVDMYAKCGNLEDARRVFDSMCTRDVVTWNSLINGYAEHGDGHQALVLYVRMEEGGMILPDKFSFSCLLKACSSIGAIQQGRQLHTKIVERGLDANIIIGNCLVVMYANCGSLEEARVVFDSFPTKKLGMWNSMINGYVEHGLGLEALTLYSKMEQECMPAPNNITFACLLKGCSSVEFLQQGKQLHTRIVERGLEADVVVGTSLVNMYAKCGILEDAHSVFDSLPTRDVVAWTALINGYAEYGQGNEALALYSRMEQEGMTVPNNINFACLLKACTSLGAIQQGRQLHAQIMDRGLEADVLIGKCLVEMYAKCGFLQDARQVFDSLPTRDVVTWTAMLGGYVGHEQSHEALAIYEGMEQEGVVAPNNVTFACLLKACTNSGAVQMGMHLHAQIVERGLEADIAIGSCLVDMYAKCGSLEDARNVFDSLPTKNVVTWNSMIDGFGRSNDGQQAIQCFHDMLQHGVEPDGTTFICLLVACSHGGLVNEGRQYFTAMVADHGILPTRQHYVCMVDLLGRSGHLDEAERMLLSMPVLSDVVGWMSLLTACRGHCDIERGRRCFNIIVRLDPQKAAAYMLMANIYADAGRWADVDRIEKLRNLAGASKKPAKAGIELNRQVHIFVVGEERNDLASKSRSMNVRLKEEGGHVPLTGLVLRPVSEKEKEDVLCGHAEKLALAYGLLNTPDGASLLVTKNLRMCRDCHSSTEIMSRIEKRQIVVRDAHRVHRFVDGTCSCGNRP